MTLWLVVLAGVFGVLLGWLVSALRASKRERELSIELESARARLQSQEALDQERVQTVERAQERLKLAFDELANASLRNNNEVFLQLAREKLGQQQLQATHSLQEREQAIETLLKPIRDALQKTEAQIANIEKDRLDSFVQLRTHIESMVQSQLALQRETRTLVNALRRPEVRGQWGELTLRRLVELAGMQKHCDFTEQVHTVTTDGTLRPDMVIHMVDSRDMVVDVKTPLDAYLEAIDATTDEARTIALRRHAGIVADRVRQLAGKGYWEQFEKSPDFVILFIPGDQFLSAALNERPSLYDEAVSQGVLLATPTSFIAILKAISYGWRQQVLAQNAEDIRDVGLELFKRLSIFVAHLAKTGRQLSSGVEAYNSAVGSFDRLLVPAARRFEELGLKSDRVLDPLEPIEKIAREPATLLELESGQARFDLDTDAAPAAEPTPDPEEASGS